MDIEDKVISGKTVARLLRVYQGMASGDSGRVYWDAFYSTFQKKHGMIEEEDLIYYLDFCVRKSLILAELFAMNGSHPPAYGGFVGSLTPAGREYLRASKKEKIHQVFASRFGILAMATVALAAVVKGYSSTLID